MAGKRKGNGSRQRAAIDPVRQAKLLDLGTPSVRPLKAYAYDPSQGTLLGNQMELAVRYEELAPGPVVKDLRAPDRIAIVDYDASNGVYYDPIDLDDPKILIRGGLDPIEADPRFHQQMVYAVVTDTIQHFEAALGRRIHWRLCEYEHKASRKDDIHRLNIFPHAMVSANAFYSPKAHGILFGYFRARAEEQGHNLPGQLVYTCLSHDIVVHETTHAIIDGIRSHFTEQTNPDVAAFHEGFADLAALFRHFSHSEVLMDAIQRTGGMLFNPMLAADAPVAAGDTAKITAQIEKRNPLVELAQQFGEARGMGRGLRSALDKDPQPSDMAKVFEPHARGAILVAAVFDAYFTVYVRRTADFFRIYRSGGGSITADLPAALARLLAEQASRIASVFFKVCVRALDYSPPVDITFGDFLRALITADFDLHPTDDLGLRDAVMQAFRRRGIVPDGAAFFSDTAIAWPAAVELPPVKNLVFGDPNGLTKDEKDRDGDLLRAYFRDPSVRRQYAAANALELDGDIAVPSFHPTFRVGEDGALRIEMVLEVVQHREVAFDPGEPGFGSYLLHGGATVIVRKPPVEDGSGDAAIRFVIGKQIGGDAGERRQARQTAHYQRLGLVDGGDSRRFMIDFALTHGGY